MGDIDSVNIAGCIAFIAIGVITFFFSFSRRAFIKFFCNDENYRDAVRNLPQEREFRFAFRFFAAVEVIIGLLILFVFP